MSGNFSNEILTDEQSFKEMIEGFAASRPRSETRHFPRFPTAAALTGQLDKADPNGLLIYESRGAAAHGDSTQPQSAPGNGISKDFRIVDFSERGFQLQFPYDAALPFINQSVALVIGSEKVSANFSWFRHTPPNSRGGVSFADEARGSTALMSLIVKLGEELVQFLMEGLQDVRVNRTERAAVYTCYAIFHGLRLQFLQALASVWELILDVRDRPKTLGQFEESVLVRSGFRMDKWELGDMQELALAPAAAVFMKPFYEFGCALMGFHEDSLFLEDDALAVVTHSILLPRQMFADRLKLLPGSQSLHQSLLKLRNLFPGMFDDTQYDLQFGYYWALITQMQAYGEDLVYQSCDQDPFKAYSTDTGAAGPASDPGAMASGRTKEMGKPQARQARGGQAAVSGEIVKVFAHSGKQINITCPECNAMKVLSAEQASNIGGSRKVRCSCGLIFTAFFERRRTHRKATRLSGRWRLQGEMEYRPMVVLDLSRGGLCFELLADGAGSFKDTGVVRVEDGLEVEFRLDNAKQAVIRGKAAVRYVSGPIVRAEFTAMDGQSNKDLGFYFW